MKIRRARPEDAWGIHEAHMLSIRTICSKDHSPEEVAAWGGRPFNEARWLEAIRDHFVWVVEIENKIEGYAHLRTYEKDSLKLAHIHGLYLTLAAIGKGFGYQLAQLMINEARTAKAKRIGLESTITAHEFYRRLGFKDEGSQITVEIAGTPIRCFPMSIDLVLEKY